MRVGRRAWVRIAAATVVFVLGASALVFLRGPSSLQRRYYPLEYEVSIANSARHHDLNPYLIAAVINAESAFEPTTASAAGAVGLMQVLPSTARELARRGVVDGTRYPVASLSDPSVSIEYGSAYLRQLIERYHEVEPALAAYNAGPKRADAWVAMGGDIRDAIDFPQTRHYVVRVIRNRERYEALYPETFSWWTRSQESK